MAYTGTENNMNSRTVPTISLKESNDMNEQSVMSLNTGKRKEYIANIGINYLSTSS